MASLSFSVRAENLEELKTRAEEAFSRRYEIDQAEKAVELFERILEIIPDSEEHWVKAHQQDLCVFQICRLIF